METTVVLGVVGVFVTCSVVVVGLSVVDEGNVLIAVVEDVFICSVVVEET